VLISQAVGVKPAGKQTRTGGLTPPARLFFRTLLASLGENRLEGYAYLFRIVLPLLNAKGERVFTDPILDELFRVLDDRFGGCMVASSSSAPPLWGLWHPPQESQAEKDYLTTAEVLASPIEAANRFFASLGKTKVSGTFSRLKRFLTPLFSEVNENASVSKISCRARRSGSPPAALPVLAHLLLKPDADLDT
jgi:hypothetical protein